MKFIRHNNQIVSLDNVKYVNFSVAVSKYYIYIYYFGNEETRISLGENESAAKALYEKISQILLKTS